MGDREGVGAAGEGEERRRRRRRGGGGGEEKARSASLPQYRIAWHKLSWKRMSALGRILMDFTMPFSSAVPL